MHQVGFYYTEDITMCFSPFPCYFLFPDLNIFFTTLLLSTLGLHQTNFVPHAVEMAVQPDTRLNGVRLFSSEFEVPVESCCLAFQSV